MKIIEALKQIKDLQRKSEDLRTKISQHSAYLDNERPVYDNQTEQIKKWLDAHNGILSEILRLRIAIQKTNLETNVSIKIGEDTLTKSIAEWIHRRRDLASFEALAWSKLTDKGLKDTIVPQSSGMPIKVQIIRCFDPVTRDMKREIYTSEPHMIDARLEVINATVDIIE